MHSPLFATLRPSTVACGLPLTVPSASETTAPHDETLCALLLPYFKMLIAYDQEPAQAGCQLHADARRGHAVEELAPG